MRNTFFIAQCIFVLPTRYAPGIPIKAVKIDERKAWKSVKRIFDALSKSALYENPPEKRRLRINGIKSDIIMYKIGIEATMKPLNFFL